MVGTVGRHSVFLVRPLAILVLRFGKAIALLQADHAQIRQRSSVSRFADFDVQPIVWRAVSRFKLRSLAHVLTALRRVAE